MSSLQPAVNELLTARAIGNARYPLKCFNEALIKLSIKVDYEHRRIQQNRVIEIAIPQYVHAPTCFGIFIS